MRKARVARADEQGTAAIAGTAAAEIYGLNMLVPEIEDHPDNTTRFLVIGRQALSAERRGQDDAACIGRAYRCTRALFRMLEPFARNSISMTRIESRPSRRRKWDYVFFIDLEGHAEREPLASRSPSSRRRRLCAACWGPTQRGL
jgi:chorismate mutase/prephenate dehydratase